MSVFSPNAPKHLRIEFDSAMIEIRICIHLISYLIFYFSFLID